MQLSKAVKVLTRRLTYLASTEQGRSQNALDRIRAEQAALREAIFCIGQMQGYREAQREEYEAFKAAECPTGRLSSSNPTLQNIPIRSELSQTIIQAFTREREG